MFAGAFAGKRVLVTGHTGFKGGWLVEWLLALGAEVTGLSLAPSEQQLLFGQLGLADRTDSVFADVRDLGAVEHVVAQARADFVFHLAAQPLVRESYREPVGTFATNVMGTVHVLEALRRAARPTTCVVVTSDKAYQNREVPYGYREDDALGGHDPYSASKGATEIVAHSYLHSFFAASDSPVRLVTGRAGNVIGGGDFSVDRIVPDCMRALASESPIAVRNPQATRPWQHVLEPLSGYLWLAAVAAGATETTLSPGRGTDAGAFNFGPWADSNRPVRDLVHHVLQHWPGEWSAQASSSALHEATLLGLVIDKAVNLLGWRPTWDFETAVGVTTQWYRQVHEGADPLALTRADIARYQDSAVEADQRWAK